MNIYSLKPAACYICLKGRAFSFFVSNWKCNILLIKVIQVTNPKNFFLIKKKNLENISRSGSHLHMDTCQIPCILTMSGVKLAPLNLNRELVTQIMGKLRNPTGHSEAPLRLVTAGSCSYRSSIRIGGQVWGRGRSILGVVALLGVMQL